MGKGSRTKLLVPDRWQDYCPIGCPIRGTPFVAFKTPLNERMNLKVEMSKRFDVDRLCELIPNLGLVIDLTFTDRYYDPQTIRDKGIKYQKIYCRGQVVPSIETVKEFFQTVDDFISRPNEGGKVIGVHCTHGVNRSGYYIVRYMIQRLGFSFSQAISEFEDARGHRIDKIQNYVNILNGIIEPIPHFGKLDLKLIDQFYGPRSSYTGVPLKKSMMSIDMDRRVEKESVIEKREERIRARRSPRKTGQYPNEIKGSPKIQEGPVFMDRAFPMKPRTEKSYDQSKSTSNDFPQTSHFYSDPLKSKLADNEDIRRPPPSQFNFPQGSGRTGGRDPNVGIIRRKPLTPSPPRFSQQDFEKGSGRFRREFTGGGAANVLPYNNRDLPPEPRNFETRFDGVRGRLGSPVSRWPGPSESMPIQNDPRDEHELIHTRNNSDLYGQHKPMVMRPNALNMGMGFEHMNVGMGQKPMLIGGPGVSNASLDSVSTNMGMGLRSEQVGTGPNGVVNMGMCPRPMNSNIGLGSVVIDPLAEHLGPGPMHTTMGPGPMGMGPEPIRMGPEPIRMGLEPMGMGPEPMRMGSEPMEMGRVPTEIGPGPSGMGPELIGMGAGPMGMNLGRMNVLSGNSDGAINPERFEPTDRLILGRMRDVGPRSPAGRASPTYSIDRLLPGRIRYDERHPFPDRKDQRSDSVHGISNLDDFGVRAVSSRGRSPENIISRRSRVRSPRSRSRDGDNGRSRRDVYERMRNDYDDRSRLDGNRNRSREDARSKYRLRRQDSHNRSDSRGRFRREYRDISRREISDRSGNRFSSDRSRSRSPLRRIGSRSPIHDSGYTHFYEQKPGPYTNTVSGAGGNARHLQHLKEMVRASVTDKLISSMIIASHDIIPEKLKNEKICQLESLQYAISTTLESIRQPPTDPHQHIPVSQKTLRMDINEYNRLMPPAELDDHHHRMIPGYLERYKLKTSINIESQNVDESYEFHRNTNNKPETSPFNRLN